MQTDKELIYTKTDLTHDFRIKPFGSAEKTRLQLVPSGVGIIWGHVRHKWRIVTVKIPLFLELDRAYVIAREIVELLEGNYIVEDNMLTLEKALQIWPGADIINEYKVKFQEDGGKQTAFAPSSGELISYAGERGHPVNILGVENTWKLSMTDGKWYKQEKANIINDVKRLNSLGEKLNAGSKRTPFNEGL